MLLFARENYNVIHPSVNAEQFKSGASAEYVMNKGIVSMTIPLFEMKCKGFVLPISLVFNPENVNYRTQSGQYGLGWSYSAASTIRDIAEGTTGTADGCIDIAMTGLGFLWPWGWAISNTYFIYGKDFIKRNELDIWNQ